MQTILGSGGAIGTDLAKALKQYTSDIKLVSRNPVKVNDSDILESADFSDSQQIKNVIKGSEICYITVGFEYKIKVWKDRWPFFVKNAVESCIEFNTKMVFFDNVYAIGGNNVNHITENSPISPCSKKGEIRAWIDRYIMEQVEAGKLKAIIARAPDFFGSVKKQNSLLMNLVYDNMAKGKTAQWFCNADVVHTMGYTPDLAKGTAILGNTAEAYNQIWNLPVDMNALTGREWVKLFAAEMKASEKVFVLPLWGLKLLGVFVPILREMPEMMYQFDRPYHFDCSKFFNQFKYTPTTNKDAVKQTIEILKRHEPVL
ncbi:MAG: NAD-dependent epimerase/dehydratase family protein [Bacteroidales bacterium]|jgi:nucleoside-diphosphate-sugar epimerase|nr:NAD-dependent epimerase/dehydratase family protein [Bacteroidales bacterium]